MAQRSAAVWIGTIVVTAVIAAGLTVVILEKTGEVGTRVTGDKETWLRLGPLDSNRPCELVEKASFRVKNGKKVTWRIENLCAAAQTVTIGNFRTEADENVKVENCKEATYGTIAFPFDLSGDLANRQRKVDPGEAGTKIELKAKYPGTSTSSAVYYFDVCIGTDNGGKKVDPRLIIDP